MIRHPALLNSKKWSLPPHTLQHFFSTLMSPTPWMNLESHGDMQWNFQSWSQFQTSTQKQRKPRHLSSWDHQQPSGATFQILVCSGTWHANPYHSATGVFTHWGTSTQGAPDRIDRVQATKLPDALITKYTPLSTSGLTYLQSSLVTLVPQASQKETNKPFQGDAHLAHLWRLHAWFCAQIHQMISFTVWQKNSTFSWLKLNLHFLCLNPMFYAEISPFHA